MSILDRTYLERAQSDADQMLLEEGVKRILDGAYLREG